MLIRRSAHLTGATLHLTRIATAAAFVFVTGRAVVVHRAGFHFTRIATTAAAFVLVSCCLRSIRLHQWARIPAATRIHSFFGSGFRILRESDCGHRHH